MSGIAWQWFALGSAFFAGLTAIFGKVGVTGMNANLATLIRTVVILALTALIVTARAEWRWTGTGGGLALGALLLSGVATGLSWLCYYRALQLAPASLVAPLDKLSVVIAMILAVALLGESLTPRLVAGGALVTLGVLVLAWP